MTELRPYQADAIESVFDYWSEGGGNPLVVLATGLGKSVVFAEIARRVLTEWPEMRVLMLVHVQELVEQNYKALLRSWPDAPAGIYSAGLGVRQTRHRITCASIQSVFRKARELGPRHLVIVDEAHLIPAKGAGMYRSLLDDLRQEEPDLRVLGLTATPFRLDSGRIDRGGDRLFDKVVYNYGVGEGIADGWLSPLRSRSGEVEIDVSGVTKRGGEFVAESLEKAANDASLITRACAEIVRRGVDRRSWLIFCAGVENAFRVRDELRRLGVEAATVTGETPKDERRRIIADFKSGKLRALTNAQVLTTGFDAPSTDLIAFLRPTLSTGLYVQMIGRGTRKAEGKADCLVLDFSGNVRRHGPVDLVVGRDPSKKGATDEEVTKAAVDDVRAKECPDCMTLNALGAKECVACGYEWPEKPKHEAKPDEDTPVLSTHRKDPALAPGMWRADVFAWSLHLHQKEGGPPTVRVEYMADAVRKEWLCPEHRGFPRTKFERWWRDHTAHLPGGASPIPDTVAEVLERAAELRRPRALLLRKPDRFVEVISQDFPSLDEPANPPQAFGLDNVLAWAAAS